MFDLKYFHYVKRPVALKLATLVRHHTFPRFIDRITLFWQHFVQILPGFDLENHELYSLHTITHIFKVHWPSTFKFSTLNHHPTQTYLQRFDNSFYLILPKYTPLQSRRKDIRPWIFWKSIDQLLTPYTNNCQTSIGLNLTTR